MQSKKCGYVALLVSYTKKCWVFLQIHTQDVTSRYHPLRWPKAKQVSIRSGEWVLSASQLAVWYQMPWVWPRGELNLSRAPRRVASSERKRQPIQHESEWERQGCRQGTLGQGLQVYGYLWRRSFGQVRLIGTSLLNSVQLNFIHTAPNYSNSRLKYLNTLQINMTSTT